jgi:uncharacterized membrane protein
MPRTVHISLPAQQADELIAEIRDLDGLIGLRLQRGISIQPPGDVLTIEVTNRALHEVMQRLAARGIGRTAAASITTSEPKSVISAPHVEAITRDSSDATWEEMELMMGKESNMTGNGLALMTICGILATIGIATNALHIVLSAMLIAPGFEPITRIGLGTVTRSAAWRRGLADTLKGYAALVLGAAGTTLALLALGKEPLGGEATYLPAGVLISYWTTMTLPSLLVTVVASIAGAVLIATNRSVLTGGVMVGLALIPAATIGSMALVAGEARIGGQALLRWLVEAGCVGLFAIVVFALKKRRVQKRQMLP